MLEYPEINTIVGQMKHELIGKTITSGVLLKKNNNLFMSESDANRYQFLASGKVTHIEQMGVEFYIFLDNGYGILFCQSGGKILFNRSESDLPKAYNIRFDFHDGSVLTYTMQLFSLGVFVISHQDWENRKKNCDKFDPFDERGFDGFMNFVSELPEDEKKQIKIFLASHVQGIMSTFAAEILLYAGIHPSIQMKKLDRTAYERIYNSMKYVLTDAINKKGRCTECDLYGINGDYIAAAERKNIGSPCPICGTVMEKNSVGGITAFCPDCQKK
ncbi:MAG: hypothetical protein J6I45_07915 [Clostridia bacterium]|nr:hypothetical protein [Clostridia bacterium]